MYKHFEYNIKLFQWCSEINALVTDAIYLWCNGYSYPFPNGKKQFYIKNHTTGGFRRFRYKSENGNDIFFVSEDDIICQIKNYKIPEESLLSS